MHNEVSSGLFNLIHSMSQGEKRYLKLYARTRAPHKNSMNHLRLFDMIEKQRTYNEEKTAHSQALGIKKDHLPALKYHLRNLILESLRVLRGKEKNTGSRLKNMMENARIMKDKGLREEELNYLKKTKALALRDEQWGIAMEALRQEIQIMVERNNFKTQQELEKEMEILLSKLNNIIEYRKINRKVFTIIFQSAMQRSGVHGKLKAIFSHSLLCDPDNALSLEAKCLYFNIHINYCFFKGDFQKADVFVTQIIHLLESSNSNSDFLMLAYSSSLSNLFNTKCYLGKYNEAFEIR